jgi:preprotein translocase SecE subunit
MRTGARPEDYGEHTVEHESGGDAQARSAAPGVTPEPVVPEQDPPDQTSQDAPAAPAPSRADVGAPDAPDEHPGESREQRRARKKQEKQERKQLREREMQKLQKSQGQDKPEKKRRGGVFGFLASCWAELKKVQWPDRDTLVQASAVTIIFVAIAAAYLGALDAAFNWLIKQII